MIDFSNSNVLGHEPKKLREHRLLEFKTSVSQKTGELGSYAYAVYKGLKFTIYDPTEANPEGRIILGGSLHKFWNNGLYNYNDFGLGDIRSVLFEIETLFGIAPDQLRLRQLELGVNLTLEESPASILENMLFHKTDPINSPMPGHKGTYYHVTRSQKVLKFYDKSRHMVYNGIKSPENLFRAEVKYLKMAEINRKGIFTMSDLVNSNLPGLVGSILIKEWNGVILYDESALINHPMKEKYGNPRFWKELEYENFKYHRRQLEKVYASSAENLKPKISRMILEKTRELDGNPTGIYPLCIQ